MVSQLAGAFLGSAIVLVSLGDLAHLGATVPAQADALRAFVLEFAFTAALVASVFVLADRGVGRWRWRLALPPAVVGVSTYLIGLDRLLAQPSAHDRTCRALRDVFRDLGLPHRGPVGGVRGRPRMAA